MTVQYVGVEPKEEPISRLVFSDSETYSHIVGVEYNGEGKIIELTETYKRGSGWYIRIKDIDNMIEALKLAKELWGNTDSE